MRPLHALAWALLVLIASGTGQARAEDAATSDPAQTPMPAQRADPEEQRDLPLGPDDTPNFDPPPPEPEGAPPKAGEYDPPSTQEERVEAIHEASPEVGALIEALPEGIQDGATVVAAGMVASRSPPNRFLYSIMGLPRGRFGTGTSWLPDESPLLASVPHIGKWGILAHGTFYMGYDYYSSERGGRRFFGRNSLMGALFRTFKESEVLFRLALSLEPLTIGDRGYPQVLQTGQMADGRRIHDRMYALDFFREVAITYSWKVTERWAATVYAALAGEPGVGPVTFTQRFSASPDPLAPLGFSAQETSHASFGVLTVGAFTKDLKIEASWFNGDLPGKHRFRLALRRPDAYAVRISWNPFTWLSTQLSYAFMESPVRNAPERSDHKISASATYTRWHSNDSGLAATMSFAERVTTNADFNTALMMEAYWNIDGHHAVFGRAEIMQKSGRELVLPENTTELFAVGAIGTGYIYYFGPYISLTPGLGLRASINVMENDLARYYGGQAAWGLMAYAQLRTAALPIGT